MVASAKRFVTRKGLEEYNPEIFSENTLANWAAQGVGPPYTRAAGGGRGKAIYDIELVEKWLAARIASDAAQRCPEIYRVTEEGGGPQAPQKPQPMRRRRNNNDLASCPPKPRSKGQGGAS